MCLNRMNYVLQERSEAGEVNFVCVWPDHFMSEYHLAVMLLRVKIISVVKSLAFNHSFLNARIKRVFYF